MSMRETVSCFSQALSAQYCLSSLISVLILCNMCTCKTCQLLGCRADDANSGNARWDAQAPQGSTGRVSLLSFDLIIARHDVWATGSHCVTFEGHNRTRRKPFSLSGFCNAIIITNAISQRPNQHVREIEHRSRGLGGGAVLAVPQQCMRLRHHMGKALSMLLGKATVGRHHTARPILLLSLCAYHPRCTSNVRLRSS